MIWNDIPYVGGPGGEPGGARELGWFHIIDSVVPMVRGYNQLGAWEQTDWKPTKTQMLRYSFPKLIDTD